MTVIPPLLLTCIEFGIDLHFTDEMKKISPTQHISTGQWISALSKLALSSCFHAAFMGRSVKAFLSCTQARCTFRGCFQRAFKKKSPLSSGCINWDVLLDAPNARANRWSKRHLGPPLCHPVIRTRSRRR